MDYEANKMKLSELLKETYKASNFKSVNALATRTGQTQPFVAGLLADERKDGMIKMDAVFDELTRDVEPEELIKALALVRALRKEPA